MKSFNQAAGTYESFGFIQRELAAWLAEWLPTERRGPAVEAGAGTGMLTRHLLPWNGHLLATDASPAMVAIGAKNLPEADWRTTPADQLPNVSAGWILSASFLQWAPDPSALLRHWKSCLASDGRILAGFFVEPTLTELYHVLPETAPLQWRTPDQWAAEIGAAGLKLVRAEAAERVFIFPSCLHLLRTLHGVGAAPNRRTPPKVLRKSMRDYDTRFTQMNGVRSTWTFYRFEAKRR